MQTHTRILFMTLAVATLAACSGTQEKSSYSAATRVEAPSNLTVDDVYVNRVEYLARQRGVEVHWVNMPTKHLATTTQ